jgi:hypothetical protein
MPHASVGDLARESLIEWQVAMEVGTCGEKGTEAKHGIQWVSRGGRTDGRTG